MIMLEKWKNAQDKGEYVCVLFMDLSKAFDTINPDLLLTKLRAYGFSNNALNLMGIFFLGPPPTTLYVGPWPLGPSAPQILSVQFQGLGWYNRDEILKLSIKYSYLQNYNIHYQQKNFSCLVCTWYICRQAICQLRHRHGGINKYN